MHSLIKEGGYGQDEETRKMMKLGYVNALEVRTQTRRIAHLKQIWKLIPLKLESSNIYSTCFWSV